jgi:hypothetical protein
MQVLGRFLLSRWFIGVLQLLLVLPMALAVFEVGHELFNHPDLREQMEIVTGVGVIMIGFGVALEERHIVREVFGLAGGPHEAWEERVDHICHKYGVGLLVLGLFAEICIEAIKIPNTILYTGEVDDYLVAAGLVFVAIAAALLARGSIILLFLTPGPQAVPGPRTVH